MNQFTPRDVSNRLVINPLDVLTLAGAYGDRVREGLEHLWPGSYIEGIVSNAVRAFHHAITFTELDDSYRRTW